ncbi:hypothetical protein KQX54_007502 [Cotesia glomerata]|uniref:Protein kinase domain-containing protein n=1 Tax=Cotesia glomerata TaxID=32391 RepID=A0AAV7IFD0_COTGL|nr:hypothetical protein KQX54_007502 [Cotesia glomerata]
MNFIKIKDKETTVKLPINKQKLKVDVVKTYFPGASGLTFFDGIDKCGICIENHEFHLIEGVDEYEVFYTNSLKEKNYSDAKRKKFNEIMEIIDGKENQSSIPHQPPDISTHPKKILKILHVGWKHRDDCSKNYKQQIAPYGGIVKVELNHNEKYSFDTIKALSLSAMDNIYNRSLLSNSVVLLGNFKEKIFENFATTNDPKNDDFWKFSDTMKSKNGQYRLYLYSTVSTSEESEVECSTVTPLPNVNQPESGDKSISDPKPSTSGEKAITDLKKLSSRIKMSAKFYPPNSGFKSITHCKPLASNTKSSIDSNRCSSSKKSSSKSRYTGTVLSLSQSVKSSHGSRINTNSHKNTLESNMTQDNNEVIRVSIPTIQETEINFTDTVLGSGSFGSVILSTWNSSEVAVKKIKADNRKYIYREINVMDKNIMFTSLWSITRAKNLANFISTRNVDLDYEVRKNENYGISLQICKAITFLHQFNPTVLHKDIKPENILINHCLDIKICDFGLSNICDGSPGLETTVGHYFQGSPLYMAPEILIDQEQASRYSDVWSLTCCIVELFSGTKVWSEHSSISIPKLRKIVTDQKVPCLESIPTSIIDTIKNCFDHNPKKRPSAAIMLQMFKRIYKPA